MRKYLLVAGLLAAFPAYAQTTYQGGAGGSVATTSVPGTVQPDGVTITVDGAGVITAVTGGGGDVVGPASATVDHVVAFDGTTGKLIKGGGIATSALATLTGTQTLTNKTLTSPTIAGGILSGTLLSGSTTSFNGPGGFARTNQFYTSAGTQFGRHSADTSGAANTYTKSRHATVGSHTAVVSGDGMSTVAAAGSDGTSYVVSAQTLTQVDGAVSTNIVPGRITWLTMNAAGSMLERMRLSSSGGLHVGITPTDPGVNNLAVQGTLTAANTTLTGIANGTQDRCLGLTSGNAVVSTAGACGAGGSVSVTAATPNIVVTPSPGTGTFTVGTTTSLNTQSGNSGYTILSTDAGKVVNRTNTVTQSDPIPQATGSFGAGFGFGYQTAGVGNTLTSTTSTINGIAGATGIKIGARQAVDCVSDGTNWNCALGAPQPATQTGTTVLLDTGAYAPPPVPPTSAGTSITLAGPRQNFYCTGTCTVTVPAPVAGYQFCVFNDNNVATVITLAAIGSSAMYENTARTAYGTAGTGTAVSGAAAANAICLLGRDSTHYTTTSFTGTWTMN